MSLFNILVGICVDVAVHNLSSNSWPILATPPSDDPLIQQLIGLNSLWGYQVTLCTFVLTFFTAEAYKHWRLVYFTTRAIQGRINDICMLVTMGAAAAQQNQQDSSSNSQQKQQASQELVNLTTRLLQRR